MADKVKKAAKPVATTPGPVYGLGFIGALVFYLHTTTGFWPSIVAILKAFVWPAFFVYHLLGL